MVFVLYITNMLLLIAVLYASRDSRSSTFNKYGKSRSVQVAITAIALIGFFAIDALLPTALSVLLLGVLIVIQVLKVRAFYNAGAYTKPSL